ncbi:hypothetical protein [Heyndrickxia sporothermodurans]|uniref:Uncharacterized protein n=1 Tax=Heyndrickxia sporothermodurans TaxID=46224 RepID=A0AB37HMT3_9BACI|nr:hypothetical protein [Heyndrickxia sporothermodurans]MBY0155575.1 hypothetical protein [Cytobacillus firmus]MBL5768558.1 hypothetical protein [Heyndrickxia sporothermodurans]MBL5772011.1 hypothetical protein [Heyndrickxia sporothermodurans]MBL5775976.1 hypothetical protein [Heyndrickxia sporothermodurans]MBL5782770.1 hypothetical protein [Heyndrickxia sporothermodurans]
MTIDWTTVLTHLLTLLLGATGGYLFKSIRVNQNTNETKGKNSPIFTNKGDVKGNFGDRK